MSVKSVVGFCLLCTISEALPGNTECGKSNDVSDIPWTVGIYLEKDQDHLELLCLGTIVKEHRVVTAAQCVCESFSNQLRKEKIFVSTKVQKQLEKNSNVLNVKRKDIVKSSDYKGFFLNPAADLAIMKVDDLEKIGSPICVDWSDLNCLLEGEKIGKFPLWDQQLKTVDIRFLDYDSCALSTSEEFSGILGHDKHCFKVSAPDLVPESIGSGIYFKNSKDGKWYLEGTVSSTETAKNGTFVAATSLRHYLGWLSRVCL